MDALVKNAADVEQVKEAKRKEKFGRDLELNDLREILSTVSGRRFVWRYLSVCGIFSGGFVADPNYANFRDGEQNIGLRLLNDVIEASPEAYLMMMNEAKKRG